MAARRVLLGALATLGAVVAASRIGVLLHEGGHLGAGVLHGGRPVWLQVVLLGGGSANCDWGAAGASEAARDAFDLGGIAITAALGVPVAFLLARRAAGGALDLLARAFAAAAILGALHYLVAGSYYGHGDTERFPRLWPLGLALAMPASWLALAPAAAWCGARVSSEDAGFARRAGTFLLVALLALAGYAGLHALLERRDFAAVAARGVAVARAEEEVRAEKWREALAARAAEVKAIEARGEPVPATLATGPRLEEIRVAPAEVPKPFPVEVPLGACYVVAAVLASRARAKAEVRREVGVADAAIALALGAAALLAVLPLRDGVRLG